MKFSEAMKALEEGKKVRKKDWPKTAYWAFTQKGNLWMDIVDLFVLAGSEWELLDEAEKNQNKQDIAKQCYDQICRAVDELRKQGIECDYPVGVNINGQYFDMQPKKE